MTTRHQAILGLLLVSSVVLMMGLARFKRAHAPNGRRISVVYRIELHDTLSVVMKESLEADGNRVDASAGQLFLVDLTTVPTVCRQLKVQMPAI